MIVAGEASGDIHAANLLTAMRGESAAVEAFGVGGERLRAAGLQCIARSEELSVMGLAEVVRELPRLIGLSRRVRREALALRPDVAVLVDSPDFNLPLARHLRRAGVPVVLYVSPQLWAWREGRVARIRRDVSRVLCLLPFEVPFYARHGVPAEYVGHPLVDEVAGVVADRERDGATVALLPGSRWHLVQALLPTMLAAVELVRRSAPNVHVRLILAGGLSRERVVAALGGADVEIVEHDRNAALAGCDAAIVASGTATLVCALLDVPMVVCYRMHPLSYLLARALVRVPHASLVNLVGGEEIVRELVQRSFTAGNVAAEAVALLGEGGSRQRASLARVRAALGEPGASRRAAQAVLEVVGVGR